MCQELNKNPRAIHFEKLSRASLWPMKRASSNITTGKSKAKKLKSLPVFASDSEAEKFVDRADLTKFDLSNGRGVRFEFERKPA